MTPYHFRLGIIMATLAGAVGCASDDQLLQERSGLESNRSQLQGHLDQMPPNSRWSGHRDTERVIGGIGSINSRIGEIDRELGR